MVRALISILIFRTKLFFSFFLIYVDHLALIIELLGEQKTQHLIIGKYGKHFFDPNGDLKNIKKLKYWPLQQVLVYVFHA